MLTTSRVFLPGLLAVCVLIGPADAQTSVILESGEAIAVEAVPADVVITSPSSPPAIPTPGQPGQPMPPGAKPGQPGQPGQPGAATPGQKPGDKKPKPEPKFIVRPEKPDKPADPRELLIKPGTDGKMALSFSGQTWPDVLRWLKRVSKSSLDWEELPKGYINVVTTRRYSVPEIRDILNRHLLTRGFTILINDEMMTVEKVDKLNPALVPRVTEDELDKRYDHEFVKVSFALKSMLAHEAVEELTPMKSPNGKLVALTRTNRLEAMDAVINLREIREVIRAEQSGEEDKRLVRPFALKYVKAEDVVNQLKGLLGDSVAATTGGGGAMNPQQMQQMMQMMQQQAQAAAAAAAAGGGKKRRPVEKVHIIANVRDNEILVNAPPDKMALIEEAVLILDKQKGSSDTRLGSVTETEVYRLTSLSPDSFLTILNELGGVSPRTRIQIDTGKKALIVSGPRPDHIIIEMLVKKLDGSNRHFHVIPLRKHNADYVAGSIRFMMGTEAEKEGDGQRRSFFFDGFGGFSRRQQQQSKDDTFRVDADVEYNRLLLKCNDDELQRIKHLLVELGELRDPLGNPSRRRSIQVDSLEDALRMIDRLEKSWPDRRGNKLHIAPLPELPKKDERPLPPASPDQLETTKPKAEEKSVTKPAETEPEPTAAVDPQREKLFRLLEFTQTEPDAKPAEAEPVPVEVEETPATPAETATEKAEEPEAEKPSVPVPTAEPDTEKPADLDPEAARLQQLIDRLRKDRAAATGISGGAPVSTAGSPIKVRVSPNGRIYIESDDTAALDELEEALAELAPPRKDWKVIQLKYPDTWALGIELILHDVFKEEIEAGEKGGGVEWDPYFGLRPKTTVDAGPRSLSSRRPLKIISDRDSHTILVQGATRDQMRMIEELIAVYDRPQSSEPHAIRKTKIFQLQYTKAPVIAEAIKDVYRDLLSENDRALQQNQQGKEKDRPSDRGVTYIYGNSGGDDGDSAQESRIKFKGQLSIGVDSVSNILIVSAAGGLLDNIGQIIESLDAAAKPNSAVQVIQVDSRVNPRLLQQKLHKIFGPKPAQQKNQGQKNQKGQQPNQNGEQPVVNPQNAAVIVE